MNYEPKIMSREANNCELLSPVVIFAPLGNSNKLDCSRLSQKLCIVHCALINVPPANSPPHQYPPSMALTTSRLLPSLHALMPLLFPPHPTAH